MATRANIAIRLKKEDEGKTILFDESISPIPLCKHDTPDYVEKVSVSLGKRNYAYVYSHWDGYPSHLGKVLLENFTTYEQVLNLIAMGSISSITEERIDTYHAWYETDPQRKANCDKWETPEDKIEVSYNDEKKMLLQEEWVYLFENGEWSYRGVNEKWKKLTQENILKDIDK